MNNTLYQIMVNNTPKFNKDVTEGTAKGIFETVPEYINDRIISGMLALSPSVDMKYLGLRYVTPKEEVTKIVFNNINSVLYDIAKNDIYLVELKFTYQGKPFSRYLYLPYSEPGNLITFSDTLYHILPVLSDSVITPSYNEVFVRLLKAKLSFTSTIKNFIVDGVTVPGEVINSQILRVNEAQIVDNIGKPLVSTSLYLTSNVGLVEAYRRYGGIDSVIVTNGDVTDYRVDYVVYESTRIRPKSLKEFGYSPHDLKICVKRSEIKSRSFIDNFTYGLIYILDMFPESAVDLENILYAKNVNLEIKLWKILLGRVSYKNSFSVDRMYGDVEEHFIALSGYVDEHIKSKLSVNSKGINDFFDMLAMILDKYNAWTLNSREYNSSIENRYIDILYYILYDIIVGFNRVILSINKRASKKAILVEKEIIKIMNNELSPKTILNLTRSSSLNLAISACDYSSDIKYPKITSVLEDQSRGQGARRGGKNQLPEAAKTLKGGDLGFGSLLFLGKQTPSPRFKLNLFLNYNVDTGRINHPSDLERRLKKLNNLLVGRQSENTNILESELTSIDNAVE